MARTRWQTLLLLALVVAAVTWTVLRVLVGQGAGLPEVSWLVVLVEVLIAAVVLAMGWQVRQFLAGKRPDLSPLRAARTAVLGKASCYTGALLLGWYGGQLIAHLTDAGVPGAGARAASAGLAALGALVLAVVGLVVEHFCQVPPPPGDGTETAPGTDPAADPAAG